MPHPAGKSPKSVDSTAPTERPGEPIRERMQPALVAELYRDFADELRCFLLGVLSDLDRANEVLQATFAKVVEMGHTSREESRKGWLFRVAFNEALTLRRRQAVRDRGAKVLEVNLDRHVETPDDAAVRGELIGKVKSALKDLADDHQQVVRMRIYEGKTYATIASELNVPLGTVYARMQQALKLLKDEIGEE